jgi:hypothetical protein
MMPRCKNRKNCKNCKNHVGTGAPARPKAKLASDIGTAPEAHQ